MRCPVDGSTLAVTERQGVEIDWCPQCRGVWLDRGELDKLIARAPFEPVGQPADVKDWKKQKRRSLLEDVFDVG